MNAIQMLDTLLIERLIFLISSGVKVSNIILCDPYSRVKNALYIKEIYNFAIRS